MEQNFGACRLIWNLALEVKTTAWASARKRVSRFDLAKQLLELKKEYLWLYDANAQSLIQTLINLENAFEKFFKGSGYPKFKKKNGRQSFHCPADRRRIDWEKSTLTITKIADIPIRLSRRFTGEIRTVTISKTPSGKYFASILVKDEFQAPSLLPVVDKTAIGIDLGINHFVVTSEGSYFSPNQKLKNSLTRLRCLQRRASRKKKGSKNNKKANLKLALIYEKVTNQRTDTIHKVTTTLARDNQAGTIAVEDLYVAGLVKNRKLARVIADASFGEFFRQLRYKCAWNGKNLIVIDRFAPSSKRCSNCGLINQELSLSDREWTCSCGAHHDRDLNAAKNTKYYGLLKYSGEGIAGEPVESSALVEAMKQEVADFGSMSIPVKSESDYFTITRKQ